MNEATTMATMTTATMTTAAPEGYRAAHETAVFVDRSRLGMLKLSGATRLDLIHRMSTQDVKRLGPGEGAATIMTTDIGRIIDRLILYAASDSVYCLTGEDHAGALARFLMRNVFFNDDFRLEDLSPTTGILGVYGPRAGEMLAAAGFTDVAIPLHHWRQTEVGGSAAYLHRTDPVAGDGYFVMSAAADLPALRERLAAAGIVPIDEETFDYLRIESGLPRFGRELTLDYIPLEAGLWADVSFAKGCYTGQEIIARMESRGKLAKRLVRLRPDAPVEAGTEITAGGRGAGTVTSAADGPAGPLALGYVRTGALADGAELTAGDVRLALLESRAGD
jgi:aminomethyltransferase